MHRSIGTRRSLFLVVVLASASALGLAGCSDDTTSSSPPPATPEKTPVDAACSLFTAAAAATLFGVAAQPRVEGRPKSVASQCIYESPALDGQLVQFRIFDDERYYSKDLAENGTVVTGLGTKAYIDTEGPDGIVDLQFVHDGKVYALAYSNIAGDAAARASNLELLARAIDDRL